ISNIFIFIDSRLYDLYAFHINGFVWNLITTPGGIDSLGADQTNISLILTYLSVLITVHLLSLFFAHKFHSKNIQFRYILASFLILTISERLIYGYSRAQLYAPVLERADTFPLYQQLKMSSLLRSLGIEVKKASKLKLSNTEGELSYPKNTLKIKKIKKPFNIVMLVSESMRWDLLTNDVMPNTFNFSNKAWRFEQHYSGGNGTRQGLFSLFYGLQGNYWDIFLRNNRGPVFLDVLNDYNYQYFIYTSASFTYPEMDQTIFRQIPKNRLIEYNHGEPWQRDEVNTNSLISAIKNKDSKHPFFGFIFYESTHARYSFSKDMILRDNYLKNLDYAGLSRKEIAPQIDGMKARYENAAYGIDGQIKRILDYLEKSNEIDNTIIVITGDHGEEFMERGRWGHNSSFTDWQVRVPMVVWIPGTPPKAIKQRTSHLDFVPTVLKRLGVNNPVKDYSIGIDLTSPIDNRNVIVASWSDIGLINDAGKLVIPFKSTSQHKNLATDLKDNGIDGKKLTQKIRPVIMQTLSDAKYYIK
ncbi:MAG: sulfatase-like hydrolase/transferase, partial [gamma proteobacterium symbiont of Bathyaustriella thionipta]|nr:sulfatase-like hydrolase/transferase [gamma proteobacterium symbiont of Bathyaustriella thionipta]MCU7951668.1 sulfatase-like hydrolase/transferase [gamma proteobacterium symbiont of Bathyaustriella thionipta]MCU7958265.1 sulfatase-like hydrolase/transferase [gamma proteobacterium symbiont of Bathyaustriella thionipta]MCU7968094.1 sulfatase-like hydrolase/transferase [gamma proteobacterium symbiont of Bathyaustriella thionipta]